MAITKDDILTGARRRPLATGVKVPGVDAAVEGTPDDAGIGNDGTDKSAGASGTPVAEATVAPAVDAGLQGSSSGGRRVRNIRSVQTGQTGQTDEADKVDKGLKVDNDSEGSKVGQENRPGTDDDMGGAPAWPTVERYDFGGGAKSGQTEETDKGLKVDNEDEPTGLEDVRYEVTSERGGARNPRSAEEVRGRGLVETANPEDTRQEAQPGFYERVFREWARKPKSEEELERERKRRRRESVFAALGDGLSAMSNLWFTTQYAPDAYDGREGLSARARARYDKIKAENAASRREYMEGLLRAMQLDRAEDKDERNWNHTIARERIMDRFREGVQKLKENKDAREAVLASAKKAGIDTKTALDGVKKEIAEKERDYMKDHNQKMPTTPTGRGRGGGGGRGGGKGGSWGTWSAVDPKTGKIVSFPARGEAHAANQVPQGYVLIGGETVSVKNERGGVTTTTKSRSTANPGGKTPGKKKNRLGL